MNDLKKVTLHAGELDSDLLTMTDAVLAQAAVQLVSLSYCIGKNIIGMSSPCSADCDPAKATMALAHETKEALDKMAKEMISRKMTGVDSLIESISGLDRMFNEEIEKANKTLPKVGGDYEDFPYVVPKKKETYH